jgi:hypothetical protein
VGCTAVTCSGCLPIYTCRAAAARCAWLVSRARVHEQSRSSRACCRATPARQAPPKNMASMRMVASDTRTPGRLVWCTRMPADLELHSDMRTPSQEANCRAHFSLTMAGNTQGKQNIQGALLLDHRTCCLHLLLLICWPTRVPGVPRCAWAQPCTAVAIWSARQLQQARTTACCLCSRSMLVPCAHNRHTRQYWCAVQAQAPADRNVCRHASEDDS